MNPVCKQPGIALAISNHRPASNPPCFRFLFELQFDKRKVLYVENDVNDLDAMRLVGCAVAPADAHPKVLAIAKYVTQARSGEGVIKEISEWLLAG